MKNDNIVSSGASNRLRLQKNDRRDVLLRYLSELNAAAEEYTVKLEKLIADGAVMPSEYGEMLEDIGNLYLDYADKISLSRRHASGRDKKGYTFSILRSPAS